MSASLDLQRLVAAALAGIPGLTGVFDAPAPDQPPPYAVIGPDTATDWSTKTGAGHEHRIAVTVWDAGPGAARAKALMGEVEARLAALSGRSGGTAVFDARLLRAFVLTDPEGWTQGIVEFRIRTVTNPPS
jgi:hypothetical protein